MIPQIPVRSAMVTFMTSVCAAFVVAHVFAASPANADDRSPADAAIRATIEAQIAAFRVDDGGKAFSFASPRIQAMFATPERFMAMVRSGYQPVYRPTTYRFLRSEKVGSQVVQRVLMQGPDGALVTAVYNLVEIDGTWRIDGCVLERSLEGA